MIFLRQTNNPEQDLDRGFSCNVNSWVDSLSDAQEYQQEHEGFKNLMQDPMTKKWCADPELGLSGFALKDSSSFRDVLGKMEGYSSNGKDIAVFASYSYDLNVGLDGEDVFREDKILFYLSSDIKIFEDFLKLLGEGAAIYEEYADNLSLPFRFFHKKSELANNLTFLSHRLKDVKF